MAAVSEKRGRARKRHVQQELFQPARKRGGKRRGAGRKPRGYRAGTSHMKRPKIERKYPMHITLRVVPEVGSMRRHKMYKAVRDASVTTAVRERIRIVHISVQATHIHLLVEADNKLALARGMQGFQISVARNVNTALGDGARRRRGRVFADRYHLVVVRSPTQARNVLAYVMNNWRKHAEDREAGRGALVDRFSSGCSFPDWLELEHKHVMWKLPDDYDPLIVYRPRSWMLRKGWKLAGPVSAREVPSRPH